MTYVLDIKSQADKLFEEIKSDAKKSIKNKVVADKPDSK